jgi:hypothetical protein
VEKQVRDHLLTDHPLWKLSMSTRRCCQMLPSIPVFTSTTRVRSADEGQPAEDTRIPEGTRRHRELMAE